MIVQACINGARPADYHAALPLTVAEMAHDSALCIAAGAAEIHVHPRTADRRESLAAADQVMPAMRTHCPGTLIGVSTGAWIENDVEATRHCIRNWVNLPDYASVNLSETDAPTVMSLLRQRNVGIEAGLASVEDAKRFVMLPEATTVLRVLIEIGEQDIEAADRATDGILDVLKAAGVQRPILLHGFDATVWHFVRRARRQKFSTRVGLEDGKLLPDGRAARNNTELVAAAVGIFRQGAV